MQSFIQYRRFGKAVKAQYERNHEKISRGRRVDLDQPLSPSRTHSPDTDARDLEKGQPENYGIFGPGERSPTAPSPEEAPSPTHGLQGDNGMQEMQEMQEVATLKTTGTRLGTAMTGINVRDRRTREGKGGQVFIVDYERDDDPLNPHNWSFVTRMGATWVIFRYLIRFLKITLSLRESKEYHEHFTSDWHKFVLYYVHEREDVQWHGIWCPCLKGDRDDGPDVSMIELETPSRWLMWCACYFPATIWVTLFLRGSNWRWLQQYQHCGHRLDRWLRLFRRLRRPWTSNRSFWRQWSYRIASHRALPHWLWLWCFICRTHFGNSRQKSRLHCNLIIVHDFHHGLGLGTQHWRTIGFPLPRRVFRFDAAHLCWGLYLWPMESYGARIRFPHFCECRIHGSHIWTCCRWIHWTVLACVVAVDGMDYTYHLWARPRINCSLPTWDVPCDFVEMEGVISERHHRRWPFSCGGGSHRRDFLQSAQNCIISPFSPYNLWACHYSACAVPDGHLRHTLYLPEWLRFCIH